MGGWGPGNSYGVRIVKIVRFIGRSLNWFENGNRRHLSNDAAVVLKRNMENVLALLGSGVMENQRGAVPCRPSLRS